MTGTTDNYNTVTNPEQAVEQFAGEQFIDWAMAHITAVLQQTEALQALASGSFKLEKVKKFMLQRFLAAEAFWGPREGEPGFLGFAIANLSEADDPLAEGTLDLLNHKKTALVDREPWLKLLHALQLTDEDIQRAEPKEATRNYIAELSDLYSNSEWQTVAGAAAAYEAILAAEGAVLQQFLKAQAGLGDKDLEVFNPHASSGSEAVLTADHLLDKAVFDPEAKALVWHGLSRQLEISQLFLADLLKYLQG